jgi:hypothetical protein
LRFRDRFGEASSQPAHSARPVAVQAIYALLLDAILRLRTVFPSVASMIALARCIDTRLKTPSIRYANSVAVEQHLVSVRNMAQR